MNKSQALEILNYLDDNYKDFELTEEKINYWCEQLSQYDYEDISNRLKELMSEERYSYQPPFLEAITRGITKKYNKVDFSKLVYFCRICKKAFNDKEELDIHEDRCSSIKYIKNQYKRFHWPSLTGTQIRDMYNMSEEEFDEKYKIILKKVQSLTTDEMEKTRIEFIFNPPSQEKAKEFLNK